MKHPARAAAVLLLLFLAGCAKPSAEDKRPRDACSDYTRPNLDDGSVFSGENAFGHVLLVACDFSKNPPRENPRVPGTSGREAAASYIAHALANQGWRVSWQNFTGEDFLALPHGAVSGYTSDCSADGLERVRGLTFRNVVGEIGSSDPLYIVMAHFDSKLRASQDPDPENRSRPVLGANDGASGVAVMLEAARVIPRTPANGTLRFVFDDGEDGFDDCHPLAGSIFHARHLSQPERDAFGGLVVLDMVGDADARFCLTGTQELRTAIRDSAHAVGASAIANAIGCTVTDDHSPFLDLGLPAADLIDFQPGTTFTPYWHTTMDTPDQLSPEMLGQVGRVAVELADRWVG